MKGRPIEQVCRLLLAAIPAEGLDVYDAIERQAEVFGTVGRKDIFGGTIKGTHGFLNWPWGLHDGWYRLPVVIPVPVLRAWKNGYENAVSTPILMWRCAACWMGLPNCTPDGSIPEKWSACPVCQSADVKCIMDLRPGPWWGHCRPAAAGG